MRGETGALELLAIETRPVEKIFDLLEVEGRVGSRLVLPRRLLDSRLDQHQATPSASAA